jgi:hypothetical protein
MGLGDPQPTNIPDRSSLNSNPFGTAIPNSKYFTDSSPTIDRFWWSWAGLFDT